jgi:hypothetical protein
VSYPERVIQRVIVGSEDEGDTATENKAGHHRHGRPAAAVVPIEAYEPRRQRSKELSDLA